MKLVLIFASALLVAASASAPENWGDQLSSRHVRQILWPYKRSVESERTGGNSVSPLSNRIRLPFQLPDWVTKWFPDVEDVLMYTKNTIAGTPAKVVSSYINVLCNIATYTGFLKPSYVPAENQLTLDLHAPNSISEYSLSNVDRLVKDSSFSSQKNVTIFFSSWQELKNDPNDVVPILADAYVNRGTNNFIAVNVGDFVDSIYKWAVLDSKQTGNLIGEAVVQLAGQVPVQKIHLVGHGLGAHIAGVVGRYVQRVTGQQIARITALDPSKICHDEQYGAYTLQRGDAGFVDVIHSNNGVLGKSEPLGDADFYPNGPVPLQPGCVDVICSHNLAVRYFAESVRNGSESNFMAVQCTSLKDMKDNKCHNPKIPMGLNTPSYARGSYYLETNSRPPYGKDATSYNSA